MERDKIYRRWAAVAAATLTVGSVVVILALVFFAQPMGDDFCYRYSGLPALWAEIVRSYFGMSGRWATVGIHVLATGSVDLLASYGLTLAALLGVRVAVTAVLAHAVLDRAASLRFRAAATGAFCLLYWCAMPSPGDSIFWLNGALELEMCATVFLFAIAIFAGGPLTLWRGLGAVIPIVLLTGLHEMAGVAICLALAGGWVLAYRGRGGHVWVWAALFVVALAAFLIELSAPGNYVRAARQGTRWNIPHALALTAGSASAWLPRWLLDAPLLLSAALALVEPRLRLRDGWQRADVRICVLIVTLGSVASSFLIPVLALNGLLPGRVLNWLYFLFLTGLFANLLLWKEPLSRVLCMPWGAEASSQMAETSRSRICSGLLVLSFGAMFFAGNPWLGAADLAMRIRPWHAARSAALQSLQGHDADADASLPPLPATPQMYFDYDAVSPAEHPNRCMAKYFGVKSVGSPARGRWPRGAALSGRNFGLLDRP